MIHKFRYRFTLSIFPFDQFLHGVNQSIGVSAAFRKIIKIRLCVPVGLNSESLWKKLIYDRRGGYCYEHNLLFKHVLETLGFNVKGLAARILWNRPDDSVTSRSHMLLLVEADGAPFIADVGFGVLTLTTPILITPYTPQNTPHESYRLIPGAEDSYTLQVDVKDEWKPVYQFERQQHYLSDYEVLNWYTSTHPESPFVKGLIAGRTTHGQRYALRNKTWKIHYTYGDTLEYTISDANELEQVLSDTFRLSIPETIHNEDLFRRIADTDKATA